MKSSFKVPKVPFGTFGTFVNSEKQKVEDPSHFESLLFETRITEFFSKKNLNNGKFELNLLNEYEKRITANLLPYKSI